MVDLKREILSFLTTLVDPGRVITYKMLKTLNRKMLHIPD